MSQKTTIQKHAFVSILGLGICVGALSTVVSLPALVIFSVGIGIMLGGIFNALYILAERVK